MEGTAEERLRERLTSFYGELPSDEKAVLLALMAQADGAEVSGFTLGPSAVSMLGPDATSRFDAATEGPMESLSMNFSKIKVEYKEQKRDG